MENWLGGLLALLLAVVFFHRYFELRATVRPRRIIFALLVRPLLEVRAWWLRRRLARLTAEWDNWQAGELDLLHGARVYHALAQVNEELQGLEETLK